MPGAATPYDAATASVESARLPDGADERLTGYGVMGLPFRSGHYLVANHFPAASFGPGYRGVWHRDPHGRWTFYADAPADVSCSRYYGSASPAAAEQVPIEIVWTGSWSLRITIPGLLAWELSLTATPATRLISGGCRLVPDRGWNDDLVLDAMGRLAGPLLRAGRVRLHGTVPNGHHFRHAPRLVWMVTESTARIGDRDLGPSGPLPRQERLGDWWLPQRGVFAVGTSRYGVADGQQHPGRRVRALEMERSDDER